MAGPDPAPQDKTLTGVGVLVTRPAHQSEGLARAIEAAGGRALRQPMIEIAEPESWDAADTVLARLAEYHLAIFVSANAVDAALGRLERLKRTLPPGVLAACVGRASADALARHRVHDVIVPASRFDSEGLLELGALKKVAGRRVVIFRGAGGRELLADTLRRRGAQLDEVVCYRRLRPAVDRAALVARWRAREIALVVLTSVEALQNLHEVLGEFARELLAGTPAVVVSERIADAWRTLGLPGRPRVSRAPSDEAILEAIHAWRREGNSL